MNILIVDDEPMIREWFRMTVEKSGGGYRIVGEQSNGLDALEFCRTHSVDLVVTDIKMPGMSGIELIKELKEEMPKVKSVVFSSYTEFQFAADALKFGASEYILKAEITLSGLVEVLQKIKKDIDFELRAEIEMNALRYRVNESQYTIRNTYFRDLLKGGTDAVQQFDSRMRQFQIKLSEKQLSLLVIGIVRSEEQSKPLRIHEADLLENAVTNILDETVQNEIGNGCSFLYQPNLYVLLCNSVHTGMKSQRESLLILAHRIREHLHKFVGAATVIGISHAYSKLSYLPEQLSEALEASDRHLFYSESGIDWYGEESSSLSKSYIPVSTPMFYDYLERGLTEKVLSALELVMEEAGSAKLLSSKQARALVLEFVYAAINRARSSGVPMTRMEQLYADAHVEVSSCMSFQQLWNWVRMTIQAVMEAMSEQRPQYAPAVQQACEYIAEHFANDIMLQDIASHVHLSRTYISELFKKETGMNYNEYLMKVRMEKAKDLLTKERWKISEVAGRVGYANTSYFIKLFKSYTGHSPLEFMEAQQRN